MAIDFYNSVIKFDSKNHEEVNNLGNLLDNYFLAINRNAKNHFNFSDGWKEFEWRVHTKQQKTHCSKSLNLFGMKEKAIHGY